MDLYSRFSNALVVLSQNLLACLGGRRWQAEGAGVMFSVVVIGGQDGAVGGVFTEYTGCYVFRIGVKETKI